MRFAERAAVEKRLDVRYWKHTPIDVGWIVRKVIFKHSFGNFHRYAFGCCVNQQQSLLFSQLYRFCSQCTKFKRVSDDIIDAEKLIDLCAFAKYGNLKLNDLVFLLRFKLLYVVGMIKRIEIFNSVKGVDGKKHVPIKILFRASRIITVPDEKEIIKAMEEIRKNPSNVAQ